MPRLGCRHPGVCWSSEPRMESKHLVALPNRAVAPGPGAERERRRDRITTRSRRLLKASGPAPHLKTLPLHAPRPCQRLAHSVALEHIRLPHGRAEGHRSQLLAAPTPPASSRVSTAALYSGRSQAGIRGSSASVGVQLFAPAAISSRPSRFCVLKGSETESHQGPRRRIPARHTPDGRGVLSSPGPTVSRNHGQAHAAQPNPSMQRTRCARR